MNKQHCYAAFRTANHAGFGIIWCFFTTLMFDYVRPIMALERIQKTVD